MVMLASQRGFRDWVAQRVTAVVIGFYAIFFILHILLVPPANYTQWHALFSHLVMKSATLIVVLCVVWHAWLGLWTVFTDYIKSKVVRGFLYIVVFLLLLFYVIWAFEILWGSL